MSENKKGEIFTEKEVSTYLTKLRASSSDSCTIVGTANQIQTPSSGNKNSVTNLFGDVAMKKDFNM